MDDKHRCTIMLQWGRNFFVTEIADRKKAESRLFKLQWGRNFFVTEMFETNEILGDP